MVFFVTRLSSIVTLLAPAVLKVLDKTPYPLFVAVTLRIVPSTFPEPLSAR